MGWEGDVGYLITKWDWNYVNRNGIWQHRDSIHPIPSERPPLAIEKFMTSLVLYSRIVEFKDRNISIILVKTARGIAEPDIVTVHTTVIPVSAFCEVYSKRK